MGSRGCAGGERRDVWRPAVAVVKAGCVAYIFMHLKQDWGKVYCIMVPVLIIPIVMHHLSKCAAPHVGRSKSPSIGAR